VQKFALSSSGKRVSARVSLVLVPDLSNYAVFIAIHDAYHVQDVAAGARAKKLDASAGTRA